MIKKFLFAALFFSCFACQPNPNRGNTMVLGPVAGTPIGAIGYCDRNPTDELCKKVIK